MDRVIVAVFASSQTETGGGPLRSSDLVTGCYCQQHHEGTFFSFMEQNHIITQKKTWIRLACELSSVWLRLRVRSMEVHTKCSVDEVDSPGQG